MKSHNHDHFWIEDGILYETYKTIRGLRWRAVRGINHPNTDKITEEQIKEVLDEKLQNRRQE